MSKHELQDIANQYQDPNNRMDGFCPVCGSDDIKLEEIKEFFSVVGYQYKCNNPECGATFL